MHTLQIQRLSRFLYGLVLGVLGLGVQLVQAQNTPTSRYDTVAEMLAARVPASANTRISALVTGRLTANDGGGGTFFYDPSSSATTNLGTIFKPNDSGGRWLRQYSGSVNLLWFGVSPYVSNNGPIIQSAFDTFPDGNEFLLPPGIYPVATTIAITKGFVYFRGIQTVGASTAGDGSSRLIKKGSLNGSVISVRSGGSTVEGITIDGEPGNQGDGVEVLGTRVRISRVGVSKMGRDGIRIGGDNAENCNIWYLENCRSDYNGRYGVFIDSSSTDANSGQASTLDINNNTSDGLYVNRAHLNTFVNVHAEGNSGYGIRFGASAIRNFILGGDMEGNTSGQILLSSGSFFNAVLVPSSSTLVDNGTYNILLNPDENTGVLWHNGGGPSFSGNEAYNVIRANDNDRLQMGFSDLVLNTNKVSAQIFAGPADLLIASRGNNVASSISLRAGGGLPVLAKLNGTAFTLNTNFLFYGGQVSNHFSVGPTFGSGLNLATITQTNTASSATGLYINKSGVNPTGNGYGLYVDSASTGTGVATGGRFHATGGAQNYGVWVGAGDFRIDAGGLFFGNSLTTPGISSGSGSPESSVSARIGSLFLRSDGGVGTSLYIKESGTGNTGWLPVTTVGSIPVDIGVACSDETTPITTGAGKVTFRSPSAFTLTGVRASLTTAQSSGSIFTVNIKQNGASVLSTKITIDNGATTSTTATTPPVISTSAITDDAQITVDVDQVGNGTATGLKVWLIGTR